MMCKGGCIKHSWLSNTSIIILVLFYSIISAHMPGKFKETFQMILTAEIIGKAKLDAIGLIILQWKGTKLEVKSN